MTLFACLASPSTSIKEDDPFGVLYWYVRTMCLPKTTSKPTRVGGWLLVPKPPRTIVRITRRFPRYAETIDCFRALVAATMSYR